MAWKVYGFMHGHETGRTTVYGPLPCKRWVAVAGEKYKVAKRSPGSTKTPGGKREITSAMAVKYARWLAARDSIELRTDIKPMPVWSSVDVAGKLEMRVSAVMFGNARINIPNWDWVPAAPVESAVPAETAFADLLPRGLSILASAFDGLESNEPVRELEAA